MRKFFTVTLTLFCFSFLNICYAEEFNEKVKYFNLGNPEFEDYFKPKKDLFSIMDDLLWDKKAELEKTRIEEKEARQKIALNEIISMSNPKISDKDRKKFISSILKWTKHYDLPPTFVASVIHRESNFKDRYVYNGMYGPMQINVSAHKSRLKKYNYSKNDVKSLDKSIRLGCEILNELIEKTGSMDKALYRYVGSSKAHWYVRDVNKVYKKYSNLE